METKNRICAGCGKSKDPVYGGLEESSGRFLCYDCLKKEYGTDDDDEWIKALREECVFTISGKTEFPTRDTRMGEFRDEWNRLTSVIKGWSPSCDRWDFYGNFEISVPDEGLWDFYGAILRHGVTISDVQCNWKSAHGKHREEIIRVANMAVEFRSRPNDGMQAFDRAWNAI